MAEYIPSIRILEQPAQRKLRFRYECENRSSGALVGVRSTPTNKTYPTIQVVGTGPEDRITIVISLVTETEPYKVHPNKINYKNSQGKKGCVKNGALFMNAKPMEVIAFEGMNIICVRKTDIVASLEDRKKGKIDPFRKGFKHIETHKSINLGAVRLAFELYVNEQQKYRVESDPIYDRKSKSDLVIHHISSVSSTVSGGAKIILLCDKVKKGDIMVQFYEITDDGEHVWAAIDKKDLYVHHQTAILFKTPKYHDLGIGEPVKTYMRLVRPSDGIISEPLIFEFTPMPSSLQAKQGKRTKISANAISVSNISVKQEDVAKVKRNKLTNCNIKPETPPAAAHQLPKHNIEERTSIQTASYTQQLPQFELPPQSFQCSTYRKDQDNYQMYNRTATNMYPHDNGDYVSNAPPMPRQNQNMNYNHQAFEGSAFEPMGNYAQASNYPTYVQPTSQPQIQQAHQSFAHWRTSNFNDYGNYYRDKNNQGEFYVNTTNAAMMNYNENFGAIPRHNEFGKTLNANTVLDDITNMTNNYFDGLRPELQIHGTVEANLSDSFTKVSLDQNN